MRKLFLAAGAIAMLAYALPSQAASVQPNTLIKGSGPAVYYYATNGKRLVFPTEKTYASWYGSDYSHVITLSDADLSAIPLGGNVTYKPGARLVKITTDPKVYAVSKGGYLRWIMTEDLAKQLYGQDWASKVDDIPDAFFTNYKYGTNVQSAFDYVVADETDSSPTIWQDKDMPAPQETTCANAGTGSSMTQNQAYALAQQYCVHKDVSGFKTDQAPYCNTNSGTWWFPMVYNKGTMCNPACVVNVDSGSAEINWMCTGALVP